MAISTVPQADPQIKMGLDLGWQDMTVTPEMVQNFADGVGDHNPWYFGASPFGGPVVPALFFHSLPFQQQGWFLSNRHGTLFAKQEWEFFHPVSVGETVRSHTLVVDRYRKRDREYVAATTHIFDEELHLRARATTHQSFVSQTSGEVLSKEAAEAKRAQRRQEEPSPSALGEMERVRKSVTPEMCMAFSGPTKNYHSDMDAARAFGFPEIVVAGPLSICFLGEALTSSFGEGFLSGGRLSLNLVNVLWASEAVTTRGVIDSRIPEGDGERAQIQVWVEKDDKSRTIVGTASAREGPA